MLHILLTILKVIGIILLAILGLLLVTILCVLFVPVRYKAKGRDITTGEDANPYILARITWLLHLLSVKILFENKKLLINVKILGISFFKSEEDSKDTHSKEIENEEEPEEPEEPEKTEIKENSIKEDIKNEVPETLKTDKKVIKEKVPVENKKEHKESFITKIKALWEKITGIKDKISIYKRFLTTRRSREAIKEIKAMFIKLLLYILPTKFRGWIKFGFEDPATTGQCLGYLSILYGIYGNNIDIEPDFDNQVFEASFDFKGRIRMYRLLIVAFKLWRNKWLRRFIQFTKKY